MACAGTWPNATKSMRILAHIHTFNDEDVIAQSVRAIAAQTRPVDEILIIDNASTDGTLDVELPVAVTLIRNEVNLGTSGTVHMGLQYGLEHGYDWVWIFDADSAPRPDALEKLLALFDELPEESGGRILYLCSVAFDKSTGEWHSGLLFTRHGSTRAWPAVEGGPCECAVAIWSGCLYRLDAVRRLGLPRSDYVLDWGELDYGFRAMRSGYVSYLVPASVMDHNIRGVASFRHVLKSLGPFKFSILETSPPRCYYYVRNWVYFWIYVFRPLSFPAIFRKIGKVGLWSLQFTIWPVDQHAQFAACLRGFWHGLCRNMTYRY